MEGLLKKAPLSYQYYLNFFETKFKHETRAKPLSHGQA